MRALSSEHPLAHAQHKGQVCGAKCLTSALSGRDPAALWMKREGGRDGQRGFDYRGEAMVK